MTFKSAGTGLSTNLLLVRLKEKTSSHEISFFFFLTLPPTVSGAVTSFEGQTKQPIHHQEPSNMAAPYCV